MIKLFDTTIAPDAIDRVVGVLKSGFLNQGPVVEEFEKRLSEEWGLYKPITTNSCTASLHMALECCEVKGRVVLLPSQSFIATGLAVLMAGGIPVFVDITMDGNMCLERLKYALIKHRPRAVIVVYWGGNPVDDRKFRTLCHQHNAYMIEDAAHAFGAKIGNRPIGYHTSDFTCFSFQSIKGLTTGDGGAVCCSNDNDGDKIRKMRWFGMDKTTLKRRPDGTRDCNVDILGYKYHMNDVAAAIGVGNLVDLRQRINKRKANTEFYDKAFTNIRLDYPNKITRLRNTNPFIESSNWLYTILVTDRNGFVKMMKERGIETSAVDRGIHHNDLFKQYNTEDLPTQELFESMQVSIPVHENLTTEDLYTIVESIKKGW